MTGPARLSVVVLAYERPAYRRQALASLVPQLREGDELLVVDNASPSRGAVDAVLAGFPRARLLRQDRNLGFTGGMNAGLAAARGDLVLTTEDDIVVEPGCLAALLDHAATAGGRAVLTGIMLDHGTTRIRCAGGDVALGPPYRLHLPRVGDDLSTAPAAPYEVAYVPGAFLLWPREALAALRGFRPDFFLYFDDVELALRAARLGVRFIVVPRARVSHLPPPPPSERPEIKYHMFKNMLATYLLYAPLRRLPAVAARYGLHEGLGRLRAGRAELGPFVRAWLWALGHAPALLAERAREKR